MFGERYFATRERLWAVMHGIDDLARELGSDLGTTLPLEEIARDLDQPFVFMACGEVNAGKSTLLNGLFGHELCPAGVLPETHRVLQYRYGHPSQDAEIMPLLSDCYRPLEFLRDFRVVDTPGTNSAVPGHQQATHRTLAEADLILIVFPATNPWGAATWNFLSDLSRPAQDRVVLVIQQADRKEPQDLEVILGHVRDLAFKRLGHTPPVFAVSGKLALEAKSSATLNEAKLRASGYRSLENHISKNVCEAPPRISALHAWRNHATVALQQVEGCIEDHARLHQQNDRFLAGIESEIDGLRERFALRLPTHLTGVTEIFEREAVAVSKLLGSRLRPFPSFLRLFTGDRTGLEMEMEFVRRLQSAVEAVAENDGCKIVEACTEHWQGLVERVRNAMAVDMGDTAALDETLGSAKKHFLLRLSTAAREGIGNLKVRAQLERDLRHRDMALKSFIFMTLLLTTAGATAGALGLRWLPLVLCSLAALFWVGFMIASLVTVRTIRADFLTRLHDTCGRFANTLRTDYENALREAFKDYAAVLGIVRSHLAGEKRALEPRSEKWQSLFLTLKAIEQEL